jgi:hypothetical protein
MFDILSMSANRVALTAMAPGTYNGAWVNTESGTPFEGEPFGIQLFNATVTGSTCTGTLILQNSADGVNVNATIATFPGFTITTAGVWTVNGIAVPDQVYDVIQRAISRATYPYIRAQLVTSGGTITATFSAGFCTSDIG